LATGRNTVRRTVTCALRIDYLPRSSGQGLAASTTCHRVAASARCRPTSGQSQESTRPWRECQQPDLADTTTAENPDYQCDAIHYNAIHAP
jgi:hypothetical protein